MLHYAGVVRCTVMVGLEGRRTGGDVGCRCYETCFSGRLVRGVGKRRLREEVLTFSCGFGRVVQWVMSGKWGPNEDSVMTCKRFISTGEVGLHVGEEGKSQGYGS